jgi:fumarate reductase subunit D
VNALGRVLLLLGAAGMLICAVLPWVTVKSVTFAIDLGLIGASVTPASRTVSGTDTPIWPALVAVAIVVAILGLLGVAHRLLAAVGALAILAGSALLYYVSNVIEIETRASSALEQKLADLLLTSSPGPGPPLLIASGIAILGGALLLRP